MRGSDKVERLLERLLTRYRNGDIDRRTFLRVLGVSTAAAGVGLMPMGRKALAAGDLAKSIRFDSWGGVVQEAEHDKGLAPFEKEFGVKVIEGTFDDGDKLIASVRASFPPGGEYNVWHHGGIFQYYLVQKLGLAEYLREENVPNLKSVLDSLMKAHRAVDLEGKGRISAAPYDYGATFVGYNTDEVPKEDVESIAVLWNPKYKGRIAVRDKWQTRIWFAAYYTGQDPNNITDEQAIWDALKEQLPLVKKMWTSGAESMQLLAEKEVVVEDIWSGRCQRLMDDGHPVHYAFPKEGVFGWMEGLQVFKGSPLSTAETLINFLLKPDVAIAVSEAQRYPPSLDPTRISESFPKSVTGLVDYDPTGKVDKYRWEYPPFWEKHLDDWAEKWEIIKSGA